MLPENVTAALAAGFDRARADGTMQEFEYESPMAGTIRYFHAKLTPMLQEGRQPRGFVGVVRDVTHRHAVEEARLDLVRAAERADRLEGLAALARDTAHEFNNLLTAIQGNLAMATDNPGEDHRAVPEISAAMEAAGRAAAVTRRLLTYAGEHRGRLERLDPAEFVRLLVGELQGSLPASTRLKLEIDPEVPPVEADRTLLESSFLHLIRNALDALPDGMGELGIRVFRADCSEEDLSATRVPPPPLPGAFVGIEIHDTGEGIEPEILSRIFDPFFSTRFLGRGLGLAEVTGVIRAHGGALLASSAPETGTSFILLLPALQPPGT